MNGVNCVHTNYASVLTCTRTELTSNRLGHTVVHVDSRNSKGVLVYCHLSCCLDSDLAKFKYFSLS